VGLRSLALGGVAYGLHVRSLGIALGGCAHIAEKYLQYNNSQADPFLEPSLETNE
jgi:hypothetical protein